MLAAAITEQLSPQPARNPIPLSALLRERVDGDAELRRLRGELKNWLLRGVGPFDTAVPTPFAA